MTVAGQLDVDEAGVFVVADDFEDIFEIEAAFAEHQMIVYPAAHVLDIGRRLVREADEEKARAAAIQKLIEDKKYNVSVSATRRQRTAMRTLVILLILVILAALAVYLLIDAKIIDVDVSVPVEFIK